MVAVILRGLLLASIVLPFGGCESEVPDAPPPVPAVEVESAVVEELPERVRDRLEALGYEPWVEETEAPVDEGVVLHDRARTQDGYILYANRGACSAELIDRDGALLHRWFGTPSGFWSDTALLADGTLLVVGSEASGFGKQHVDRYLRRLAWDSTVVRDYGFPAHHDVEVTPDGRILTLSTEFLDAQYGGRERSILDDEVVVIGAGDTVESRFPLFEIATATPGLTLKRFGRAGVSVAGHKRADIFHANSVDRVEPSPRAGSHPMYRPGNLLVSMRHQDMLAVIDPERSAFVWAWGDGVLQGQHSARWLDNGNILVFDNGLVRRWSRVLEIDPRTNTIVWEYPGKRNHRFFTSGGGATQRLPNGNTLVTVTSKGEMFEVTADGAVVWRFINPTRDPQKPRRATIHASKWLPGSFVLPIIAREQ